MNAPPGVDTDTSGEEFTPPLSPKADLPKAQFSISSIFPSNRLQKLRKATAEIKTQTPEEAVESAGDKSPIRNARKLEKKRVRIAEVEDESDRDAHNVETDSAGKVSNEAPELPVNDTDETNSSQVIGLLRQMMAKNAQEDIEEKTEVASASSPNPDLVKDTDSNCPTDIELPTPVGASFQKRRPGGLDFSDLFRTKQRPSKKLSSQPTTAPAGESSATPSESVSSIASCEHMPQANDVVPPNSAPPWLWIGPDERHHQTSQPYAATQVSNMQSGTSGYPPWLSAGPEQANGNDPGHPRHHFPAPNPRGQNQQYFNPSHPQSANPPFPPYYPHPRSLQPWQPYYPTWSLPPHQYHPGSPYDGTTDPPAQTREAQSPTARTARNVRDGALDSAEKANTTRIDLPDQPRSSRSRVKERSLRPATQAYTPTMVEAGIIAQPKVPEFVDQDSNTAKEAPSSHRHTASKHHPSQSGHTPTIGLSARKEERRPSAGDVAKQRHLTFSKAGETDEARDKQRRPTTGSHHHMDKLTRMAGLDRQTSREDMAAEGSGQTPLSGAKTEPSWTECLISLATCIRLGQKLLRHVEAREGGEGRQAHFYRVLTKVVASLLTQRDVVKDMTKLVGDEHGVEITQFAEETKTISTFFRSCTHKQGHSKNDTKRLSDLHAQAARSLEAGSLTHLVGQVFTLTDFLTPVVVKTVTDLLHDWVDDTLDTKSVLKALMAIQHEIAQVHRRREVSGQISKDEASGAWTLLRYIDLLYGLFVSDSTLDPAAPQDTIPGAWPAEDLAKGGSRRSLLPLGKHHNRLADKTDVPVRTDRSKRGDENCKTQPTSKGLAKTSSPSHRSPREVISGLVYPERSREKGKGDLEASPPTRPPKDISGKSSRLPTPLTKPTVAPEATATTQSPERVPLPDIRVKPYHRQSFSHSAATASRDLSPATLDSSIPVSSPIISPHSSPSQYSQEEEDALSEGTVSSDEDAKSLLAQVDSGPARVAPLNIRKKEK